MTAQKTVLIESRIYYDFNDPAFPDGKRVANERVDTYRVGDAIVHEVAAPGRGKIVYRVTDVDASGVWGVVFMNTVRELTAEEVR